MKLCNKIDCDREGTRQAQFVIYADMQHPPAHGFLGLYSCEIHATKEAADELLHPEGRAMIEAEFAKIGRAKPDWNLSFVQWIPVESGMAPEAVLDL